MAKIRSIGPWVLTSPEAASLSDRAALLLAYLPMVCDDYGVAPRHPAKIKAELFPLRPYTCDECSEMVEELERAGLVATFEADHGLWLRVCGWESQQHPNRRARSRYPLPPDTAEAVSTQCVSSAEAVPKQCAGSAERGTESESAVPKQCPSSAEALAKTYPVSPSDVLGEMAHVARVNAAPPAEIPACTAEAVRQQCASIAGEGKGDIGGRGGGVPSDPESSKPEKGIPESDSGTGQRDVFDVQLPSDEEVMRMATYINRRCRKNIQPGDRQALDPIALRLAEGHSFEELKAIVDLKAATWLGDPKMRQWLRPQTLFGNKFEKYLGEVSESGSHSRYADAF
ncbi:MAG: hypothetical protein HFJ72_08515 [Adlercreutzia sp.]|nr:hypothetical protein [Adlercreutzia sp.]